ncbi:calcium-binding protein [Pelagibacterium sp.]|uniref:calcium-binding protein n=1 Tax=Pelagibacterium sp. TaxID=1967288 RepID=UPI003A92533B
MIEVKGTQQSETTEPTRGERYAFAEAQRLNKLPMAIGLLVTAIVGYLKLALTPAQAVERPDEPNGEPEEVQITAPMAGSLPEQLEAYRNRSVAKDIEGSLAPSQPLEPAGQVGNVIGFPGPRFALADSAIIDFSEFKSAPVWSGYDNGSRFVELAPLRQSFEAPVDQEPLKLALGHKRPVRQPVEDRRNGAPESTGPVRLNNVVAGTAVLIGLSELLTNVADADGDTLVIDNVRASTGSIARSGDGWVYSSHAQTPDTDIVVTYDVSDGTSTITHTALFSVERSGELVGTQTPDHLVGTNFDDIIDGLTGNDLIDARDGDDAVFGGGGDDQIVGGAGNDLIYGGAGNDRIFGGSGDDVLVGGEGDDLIFGNDGDDIVLGESGDDYLSGGAGHDLISGGAGADVLSDGTGTDKVLGGEGDDIFIASADMEDDIFDGGPGNDTLDFSAAKRTVVVDLEEESASGADIGDEIVTAFEAIVGGSGNDIFTGSTRSEKLDGGAGNDVLDGREGADEIHDGAGKDTVSGGDGDDTVVVALDGEDDIFDGGAGRDQLDLSRATLGVTVDLKTGQLTGIEVGNDTISGFEEVLGGSGNDMFHVGDEAVVLTGGAGDDTFSFGVPLDRFMDRPQVIHDILDFLVGDRIMVAEYEFSKTRRDGEENRFEYYFQGEDAQGEDNDLRLRIRYEMEGDVEMTLLEFNYDGNQDFDLVVAIHGQHQPYLYEHAAI